MVDEEEVRRQEGVWTKEERRKREREEREKERERRGNKKCVKMINEKS